MSIAEYERELVRERTALKLEHARKSGRKFGRPAKLDADRAALARRMKANGETAATICATLGIARTTCTGAWPKAVRTSGGLRPLVSFVMTALGDLLGRCDLDPGRRGRQFERICQWFLTHDPVYAHELRRGWLWDEWP